MNKEKERQAIERLKKFEPDEPYYLAYSGGKDSDCIRILAELAGVKHEIHHNLTTVDAPETMQYIKAIPNMIIDKARYKDGTHITMWNLIPKKLMPPTRIARYCCEILKERGGQGKLKITGVRWAESARRKESSGVAKILGKPKTVQKLADESNANYTVSKAQGLILNDDNDESRRVVEHCYRTTTAIINPIVDWTDADVWEFLHHYGCEGNPLYKCGHNRVGCIGCPFANNSKRLAEFEKYPTYKRAYMTAFKKMLENLKIRGAETSWETPEGVFNWWLGIDPNQLKLFEDI